MEKLLRLLIVISLFGIISPVISAQSSQPAAVFINYTQGADRDNGLGLDVYFTLIDTVGRVVPATEVQSASLVLDDGTRYQAEVGQPTSEYYIVFVLDASGSMDGAMTDMRTAAEAAVQHTSEGARLALIRFDEEITVPVSNFTIDRNLIINGIRTIDEDGGGTCLYDALYTALEMLASVPGQRRAVILFTDGRDELTAGRGDTCSRHTYDEVIALALRPETRTTVHTIGMAGQQTNINRDELENMANTTGGFAAIGTQGDLSQLFQRIVDGLSSQWLASAVVYPQMGDRSAILRVTLDNGFSPQSDVVDFTVTKSYSNPQGLNVQTTTIPVTMTIKGIQTDIQAQQVSFELTIDGAERVAEYVFRFTNNDTGLQQFREVRSSPVENRIVFDTPNFVTGRYLVEVAAYGTDGSILASEESEVFVYLLPTPTPTATPTATNTPVPVGATLNSVQYDEAIDVFRLRLTILGSNQIQTLNIEFYNDVTGQLVGNPYRLTPQELLEIPAQGYATGQYRIVVNSLDNIGAELAETSFIFTHVLPTATPTATSSPTETPTPTATAVVAQAAIGQAQVDTNTKELIFPITVTNENLIKRYELDFVDINGIVQVNLKYNVPPYDEVHVPLDQLPPGNYTIILRALGADGRSVANESSAKIVYSPPTPTPEPSTTPIPPTATPVPLMSLEGIRQNATLFAPIIIIAVIALLVLLVILLRQPQQPTATQFLAELTGAYENQSNKPSYTPSDPAQPIDPLATNPVPMFDPHATNPVAALLLPPTTLKVENSQDTSAINREISITKSPFQIGRVKGDLLIKDDNISREHVRITYREGRFYITEMVNSRGVGATHGTLLNGQRLTAGVETILPSGALIVVGTVTHLRFITQAPDVS